MLEPQEKAETASSLSFVLVGRLLEQKVSGPLFVLVAREVGLDDEVAFKTEAA